MAPRSKSRALSWRASSGEKRRRADVPPRRPELVQHSLNLGVGVEARHFFLENEVGAHAAAREVPHAGVVFGAIGVAVEVPHAGPARVLEQFHEKERAFHVLAGEAQVLVESARLLGVEVDVKELAGFQGLRDAV